MCGIVGVWHRDNKPVEPRVLTNMRESMYSRGPDDSGIWINHSVGLAHRRLSVIELSPLGHQPMVDEDTGSVIIYNGEVYNYKDLRKELIGLGVIFKSQSDTEVILKAYRQWGCSCVSKFIGMFVFAIWDKKSQGIFVARDRLGIKPLYYYFNNKVFMFASRLSALMLHPLCPSNIDTEALGFYIDSGFIPAPWSILRGVKKLNPGNTLWVDNKGIMQRCYWDIDTITTDNSLTKLSEEDLTDKLDSLLNESVKMHMVSDVPLGAFLSGGIDSSMVVGLLRRYSKVPPKTFTIGFRDAVFNEADYAEEIASYMGTEQHTRIMHSDDLLTLLGDASRFYDEPLADYSNLPTIMISRFAKEHVTVCLSGDGGDELFGGYHIYPILSYTRFLYRMPDRARRLLGKAIAKISSRRYSVIGRSLQQPDLLSSFVSMRSIGDTFSRNLILTSDIPTIRNVFKQGYLKYVALDEVSKFCKLDIKYYLPDDILQKVDIASMSASLEVRVPFLDHRIVEFSQSLPIKYKIRGFYGKRILKKVLARYIPPKLYSRPKRGFLPPLHKWFRGELKEMIQDELSPARIKKFGYLDPQGIQSLLDLHLSNKADSQGLIWLVLCLIKWDEHFRTQKKQNEAG